MTKQVTTGFPALLAALALAPAAAAATPPELSVPESLSVSATGGGVSVGSYAATITIDGGDADGSPATIPVTLMVSTPPCNRVASLAAAQSEIQAGRDACLADGAYSSPVKLSTSAGSRVTLSAEHPGRAQISGSVTLYSHTAIDGLDLTSSSDCVRISTAQTDIAVLNSTLHDCGRDGIRWARPALDGSNESSDVLVAGNVIRNVAWNSITVRGDAATVTGNELTGSSNDAVTLWGDGHVFRSNYIHDYSNTVGNHNDAFQTWGGDDDGFRGTPLTNLVIEANRIVNFLGPDAHGVMVSGENSDLTIRRNLWWNIDSLRAEPPAGPDRRGRAVQHVREHRDRAVQHRDEREDRRQHLLGRPPLLRHGVQLHARLQPRRDVDPRRDARAAGGPDVRGRVGLPPAGDERGRRLRRRGDRTADGPRREAGQRRARPRRVRAVTVSRHRGGRI